MFNIFKGNKPKLFELIPKRFVDIHSHILPGIDDGCKDIEESIKIINRMEDLGYSKIIFTPHTYKGLYNNTSQTIKSAYKYLKSKVKNKINFLYASEYMIDGTLNKKSKSKDILTLKDNLALLELSYAGAPNNLHEILFEIKINGYIPVIAHPERYRFFHMNNDKYELLKNIGCKFQINLFSLTGFYGGQSVENADFLLKNGFADFVGSDIHNIRQMNNFEKKIKCKNIKELNECIERTVDLFS